jgi:hypothetical protein
VVPVAHNRNNKETNATNNSSRGIINNGTEKCLVVEPACLFIPVFVVSHPPRVGVVLTSHNAHGEHYFHNERRGQVITAVWTQLFYFVSRSGKIVVARQPHFYRNGCQSKATQSMILGGHS